MPHCAARKNLKNMFFSGNKGVENPLDTYTVLVRLRDSDVNQLSDSAYLDKQKKAFTELASF